MYFVVQNEERFTRTVIVRPMKTMREGREPVRVQYNIAMGFMFEANAILAAEEYVAEYRPDAYIEVVDDRGIAVWPECMFRQEGSSTTNKGERVAPQEPLKPLNVKREDVISKLQENLDAARQERELAQAKEKAARIDVQQFITDREAEVVEYFRSQFSGSSWAVLLEKLKKTFGEGDDRPYQPRADRVSQRESDLEKFVRVLSMATDPTIEVHPDQPLYTLL